MLPQTVALQAHRLVPPAPGWQTSAADRVDAGDARLHHAYPIDPWPDEPLPDEYDLLIYAKNGHRPQLLEHLAEIFPRHIQIHYGRYQREELFEAARRSRACAYLPDDDHGPLALQEILLAGCPTVGVRTGASLVRNGVTGFLVERLPPGGQCVDNGHDEAALLAYMDALLQAQSIDRQQVRTRVAEDFQTTSIIDQLVTALDGLRDLRPDLSGRRGLGRRPQAAYVS